jgi:GTPase Era involved in 16S rRNA processing
MSHNTHIERRIKDLEDHLSAENKDDKTLLQAVRSYRKLDNIAYRLGILDEEQSYATRVSWWPMIAILGTFSSGKSTFINSYVGHNLQRTGTQAVDDKFTVICYSNQGDAKTLPGVALDADPRFPFFQISRSIAEVVSAGNQRIDAYLQLKTCPSEAMRGKILIDSPGFDADSQRAATLRITDHIIGLADLVLVFFDARHPEPGAMHDTLYHLVTQTIDRPDSNKFLYILNQMDVTAKEDNPEEVVAAWQRALAGAGLTAGRFYRIYNKKAALVISDPKVQERLEHKCEADMSEIRQRMHQVETERAYRIIGNLEQTAKDMEHKLMPQVTGLIESWRKKVLLRDASVALVAALVGGAALSATGTWEGFSALLGKIVDNPTTLGISAAIIAAIAVYIHAMMRQGAAQSVLRQLQLEVADEDMREQLVRAFRRNTRWWRSIFMNQPSGWNTHTRKEIAAILGDANNYVQDLNSRFADPSGNTTRTAG